MKIKNNLLLFTIYIKILSKKEKNKFKIFYNILR